jgi:hypothetical protein
MLEAFVDAPQHYRHLTVFPIVAGKSPVLPYIHAEDALESGVLAFQAKTERQVPSVLVRNQSLHAVLILDGERLEGSGQGQTPIRSILLAGKSVTQIPVLPEGDGSPDVEEQEPHKEEWLQVFRASERQVGILTFMGRKVLGLEALGSPELYSPVHGRLLARHVRKAWAQEAGVDGEASAEETDAARLLESLEAADRIQTESIGLGDFWILKGPVQGGELIYDGHLVHLSVIPEEDNLPPDRSNSGVY